MKYCPFLLATKWQPPNLKGEGLNPNKCECLERTCSMWDDHSRTCGFLVSPVTPRLAAQN